MRLKLSLEPRFGRPVPRTGPARPGFNGSPRAKKGFRTGEGKDWIWVSKIRVPALERKEA